METARRRLERTEAVRIEREWSDANEWTRPVLLRHTHNLSNHVLIDGTLKPATGISWNDWWVATFGQDRSIGTRLALDDIDAKWVWWYHTGHFAPRRRGSPTGAWY